MFPAIVNRISSVYGVIRYTGDIYTNTGEPHKELNFNSCSVACVNRRLVALMLQNTLAGIPLRHTATCRVGLIEDSLLCLFVVIKTENPIQKNIN